MRSRLGGFLLPTTRVVRSTGHPGVSRPSDIYSCNEVRISLKPALSATKPGLVRPIFRGGVPTRGTGQARILRGNRYEHTAFPRQLVLQLAAELEPSHFAASCGGAPLSILRQYIEAQKTPEQIGRYPSPP